MNIKKSVTVSFSGHRELKPAETNLFSEAGPVPASGGSLKAALRERVTDIIRKLYGEGYRTFLCGMAEGFDLLAGEAVTGLKTELAGIELIAVIPHPGQAYGFDTDTRSLYNRILSQAADAITICDRYRYDCFHRRNDYLVENSSVLVCFYNGSKGGTEYTVKKAVASGSRIINTA